MAAKRFFGRHTNTTGPWPTKPKRGIVSRKKLVTPNKKEPPTKNNHYQQ
jgi:hypothetical protein